MLSAQDKPPVTCRMPTVSSFFARRRGSRTTRLSYILLAAVGGFLAALIYADSGLSRTSGIMPEIVIVAPEQLVSRTCPAGMKCLPSLAFYEGAEKRIYLSRDWSPDDFHDLAILLHEFVHHLQAIGRLEYPCRGAIELPAYALQEAFYRVHERDPAARVPTRFTQFSRYSCAVEE